MDVGALGEVPFTVSHSLIQTLEKAKWSVNASIQTHSRHLDNSITEFTGNEPDKFNFEITLSKYLGSDPLEELSKLFDYLRNGKAVKLVLGEKTYGKYRWLLKSIDNTLKHYDKAGNVTSIVASVSLIEYTRR